MTDTSPPNGQATRIGQTADRRRDPRIDRRDLHRQDRNSDRGSDDGDLAMDGRRDPHDRGRCATGERTAAELLRVAVYCNNATITRAADGTWSRSGDPSEGALLLGAQQLGVDAVALQAGRDARRRRSFAFDARLKRVATLDEEPGEPLQLRAKGAPLELLARCTSIQATDGVQRSIDVAATAAVTSAFEHYAADGLRVLGFAERPAPDILQERASHDRDAAESDLCFLGLVAMRDPLRAQVPVAVVHRHRAGIRIIVITGDDGLTAGAVAREAGIVDADAQIVTGPQLDAMNDAALDQVLRSSPQLIVARSSPEVKLRIVDALRAEGHTVAMTGDGQRRAGTAPVRPADLARARPTGCGQARGA